MLKSLTIKNFVLIRYAEISFGDRLNVMSGETGAGKSVVLESINFVLGQKADKVMITNGENSCSCSCTFDVTGNQAVKTVLEDIGIDYDDTLVIKRTMTVDGKNAIKLNGETVTATMLRKVTTNLVDVHGQSDHFVLLKEANQLALLDILGGQSVIDKKAEIAVILEELKKNKQLTEKLGGGEDGAKRLDYVSYCIKEIENVNFLSGEDEELLTKKKKLMSYEKIVAALTEAENNLSGDGCATDLLSSAIRCVESLANIDELYANLSDRLSTVLDDLVDISETITSSYDDEFDPKELDYIEDRLDKINLLKSKYGKTFEAIQEKLEELKQEYNLILDSGASLEKLNGERQQLLAKLTVLYNNLTDIRKRTAENLSDKLTAKLHELGMKNAKFDVLFEKQEGLSSLGQDNVTFLFTANLGESLKPLSKVISGGELSRLMLAIKTVTGSAITQGTYIFDEIDAGISGAAGQIVAENFAQIAKTKQIIAISHLPQIVAMSDTSLMIRKSEDGGKTQTYIEGLDEETKFKEVLRLIGGNESSISAVNHAKEMIDRANNYKKTI